MSDDRIIARINEILSEWYTEDERERFWNSPQHLHNGETPWEMVQLGKGEDLLRMLEILDSGAYS